MVEGEIVKKYIVVVGMCLMMFECCLSPVYAADPASGLNHLGINLRSAMDWETTHVFADVMNITFHSC